MVDDKNCLCDKFKSLCVKICNIFDVVKCNGNNMFCYVIESGVVDIGEYIVKNLFKSFLEDGVDIVWVEVNGYGGLLLIVVIKDCVGF